MDAKQFLLISASMLASVVAAGAQGEEAQRRHIQIAEIEVDAAQLENYRAAVNEQIEAAIRTEPGVLVLYAVAEREDATRIRVFEVYRDADAYRSHLETAHFKKYKAVTEPMVRSLKLVPMVPIALGAQR
ncbi:MAG: putative quinol monooxygenase [Burkholderiales bacterium]|jgi:quinol monooxygenase YgiN